MHRLWQRIAQHFAPSKKNSYRPHLLRRSWLVFFIAMSLVIEGFLITNLSVRDAGENYLAAVEPGEVIALTNVERAQNNLGGLQENAQLDAAATAKARDMAAKGYFAHISPDGTEPWAWISSAGYSYVYAGENLAVRFIDARGVVDAWMASPSHRANIVKPVYTDIGVGTAEGIYEGQPVTFVVQYFASQKTHQTASVVSATTSAPAVAVASKKRPAKNLATGRVKAAEDMPIVPLAAPLQPHVVAPTPQSDSNTLLQSTQKEFVRAFGDARPIAQWVLAFMALALVVALSLTFFMHIQIQPVGMLVSGAFITLFVLSCMALNATLFRDDARTNLTASAVESQAGIHNADILETAAYVESAGAEQ